MRVAARAAIQGHSRREACRVRCKNLPIRSCLPSGGATGALVGLVPAVFTFGLSVPIGAAIGGVELLWSCSLGKGCAKGFRTFALSSLNLS
eukprot:804961-Amphidinium_carterae.1